MSRKKELFVPINPYNIGIYSCGPTVYGDIHIGNARPAVVFDVLRRVLIRAQVPFSKVRYIQNITDIDDKIIDASIKQKVSIEKLTTETIKAFHADMQALNVLPPTVEPRATENIPSMIHMIEQLIENGHAYVADADVLFKIASYEAYGALSRNKQEQLTDTDNDFVLWKSSTEEQPGWDSPWGRGRPGWHIECSAMSTKHLGVNFDIHCGGQDLIFPHHENEIAQNACVYPKASFARYWIHNGHVLAGGKKMAKSEGNFYTVRDLLKQFSGEVIRLFLLKTHYRKPLNFTITNLKQAEAELKSLYKIYNSIVVKPSHDKLYISEKFMAALNDDLNTPLALSVLHTLKRSDFIAAARLLGLFPRPKQRIFRLADKNFVDIIKTTPYLHEWQKQKLYEAFETTDRGRSDTFECRTDKTLEAIATDLLNMFIKHSMYPWREAKEDAIKEIAEYLERTYTNNKNDERDASRNHRDGTERDSN